MSQAPDILDHFNADILDELGLIERVNAAREDEVLPDRMP